MEILTSKLMEDLPPVPNQGTSDIQKYCQLFINQNSNCWLKMHYKDETIIQILHLLSVSFSKFGRSNRAINNYEGMMSIKNLREFKGKSHHHVIFQNHFKIAMVLTFSYLGVSSLLATKVWCNIYDRYTSCFQHIHFMHYRDCHYTTEWFSVIFFCLQMFYIELILYLSHIILYLYLFEIWHQKNGA